MVKFSSSVIISGFLGMESLKDKLENESLPASILRMTDIGIKYLADPLALIFGEKLVDRQWRKKDQ